MVEIGQLTRLNLGYVGETGSRQIEIDVSAWLNRWPEGAVAIEVRRPDGSFYLAATEKEDGMLGWVVNESDVAVAGRGMAQVIIYGVETGTVYKSRTVETIIRASIDEVLDEDAPDPMDTWVAHAAIEADRATQARIGAEEAAQRAEAAQEAIGDAVESAENAKEAAEDARDQAQEAVQAADELEEAAKESAQKAAESEAMADAHRVVAEQKAAEAEGSSAAATEAAATAQDAAQAAEDARSAAEKAATDLKDAADAAVAVSDMTGIPVTDWEQGVIASANGADGSSTTRCRSGFHRVTVGTGLRVTPNNQQYIVYTYDSDKAYLGRLSDGWVTVALQTDVDFDGYIRMCVANTASTTITPDDVAVDVELTPTIVKAVERLSDASSAVTPPIVCEVSGEVATMTDAADLPARSIVTSIRAAQTGAGDPTPDNIRPITGIDSVSLWHGAAYDGAASPALTATLPETVYGGTLDWATGVLTVTHRMIQLTGSSAEGWSPNRSGQYYAKSYLTGSPGAATIDGYCSHYQYANAFAGVAKSMQGRAAHVWLVDADLASVDAVKAYLAAQAAAGTPVTLVYPLETPYDVQIDLQQLTLLKGRNVLWSDTSDTSVAYIADTKMYIDNAIAALAASIINA